MHAGANAARVGDAEYGDEAAAAERHPSQLLGNVDSSQTVFRYFRRSPLLFFVISSYSSSPFLFPSIASFLLLRSFALSILKNNT
jgi:hypothetical protein